MSRIITGLFLTIFMLCCAGAHARDTSAPLDKNVRVNLKNLEIQPILLDAGDARRMYVIFNHSSHKTVACRLCHHEGLPGNRYAPCTNSQCHAITAPSSREPLSVYMAYHSTRSKRSCYGCHKSLRDKYPEFRGCRPCHETMRGKKVEQALKAETTPKPDQK